MSLAQRLQSVAVRYRSPLISSAANRALRSRAVPPRCRWLGSPRAVDGSAGARPSFDRLGRLEAVLFLAREPISLRKLAQLANLADGTEARTLIATLRERYDARGSAFQVEQVAGGYQLLTRPKFAAWLRPLGIVEQEIRLSAPALETLAVVAYRQPVLRAEVESIRGVACGEILRQLMDRDLLRIVGRSDELGRPLWYGTTKRFLRAFGLCSLEELPLASQLRRTAGGNASSAGITSTAPRSTNGLTGNMDAA